MHTREHKNIVLNEFSPLADKVEAKWKVFYKISILESIIMYHIPIGENMINLLAFF